MRKQKKKIKNIIDKVLSVIYKGMYRRKIMKNKKELEIKLEFQIANWLLVNNAVRIVGNDGQLRDITQKSIKELSKKIINLTS